MVMAMMMWFEPKDAAERDRILSWALYQYLRDQYEEEVQAAVTDNG